MRKILIFGLSLVIAPALFAERKEINGKWYSVFPEKGRSAAAPGQAHGHGGGGGGSTAKLVYHNGPTIQSAKVMPIFWGTYWGSGTGANERTAMVNFYQQFGTNSEYNTITQYYDTVGGGTNYIALSTLLGGNGYYDSTNPTSANVTDSMVQAEVLKVAGNSPDASTIYEVFIGPSYYSSNGSYTSCGGPNLYYCAYHGNFNHSGHDVKYSIEPYPSCSGCTVSGWTAAQNAQHFACHETREAVTDPDGNAWFDNRGYEADDECAWTYKRRATTFLDGGYGYQQEWSNEANNCVSTR